jgi:hypothetical protein
VPAPQSVQASMLVCAGETEYLPATQLVQTSLVCSGEPKNLPAAQSVQTAAPAAEYVPATQLVQTSIVCSGEPKNLPAAQSVQTEAPAAEYLPATQLVQTSFICSGEPKNLPAAQLVQTEAPAAEYVPARQFSQVEATVAPSAAENLPAAQSMQISELEYLPAAQACAAARRTCASTKRPTRLAAARVTDVVVPLLRPAVAQFTRPSAADDTSAVTSAIAVIQVVPFAEQAGSGHTIMDQLHPLRAKSLRGSVQGNEIPVDPMHKNPSFVEMEEDGGELPVAG